MFVVFEGGEGAGKSTQVALLAAWLAERGEAEVVVTAEPGGTELGRRVRALLLDPAGAAVDARAEALLYAADRAQHVAELLRPALARGAAVVCDRYLDSTLAYQGAGRVLDPADLAWLGRWATGGLAPDLTVLLDLDPAVGLARAAGAPDRIEAEPLEFHRRVAECFRALADRRPEAYLVLDATRPVEALAARVRERVSAL